MKTAQKGYDLTISVNHLNVSYDDAGEGSTPIIFIHGFPFSKAMWANQLGFLQSSHRVLAYDIRGFGKSADEKSSLSIGLFAEDLLGFMDALSIDKAIICGLSMGGYIALNAIHRFPQRFKALVLCDTQCIADTAEAKEKRLKSIEEIATTGSGAFIERFINSVFHPDSLANRRDIVESLKGVVSANSDHSIMAGLKALAGRSETCSTLGEISIPTLIMCGKEDAVTPLAQSELMNNQIKGSILRVIPDAGHMSNLEQPDDFNMHLKSFLTSLN